MISRAIEILETAYEETEDASIERQFMIAHANAGRMHLTSGSYNLAIASFDSVLGLLGEDENNDDDATLRTLRVQTLFGLGLSHFHLGDLTAALSDFESALESTGEDSTMRGHVAVLLAQTMWSIGTEEFRETAKAHLLQWCVPGYLHWLI
jgi:superkiller protein 3